MITRKIMVVPCMVNTALYAPGCRKVLRGTASWMRIRSASSPPSSMKPKLVTRYRMPMSLWSTVVNHRNAPVGRSFSTAGAGYGEAMVAIRLSLRGDPSCESSLEALQVVDQGVQVGWAHVLEGRHEHTRLDRLRIADPRAQGVRRVGDHARAKRHPAAQMGEVGPDVGRRRQAPNLVARHARVAQKHLLARRPGAGRRLALLLQPGSELVRRLAHDTHLHPGVLSPA